MRKLHLILLSCLLISSAPVFSQSKSHRQSKTHSKAVFVPDKVAEAFKKKLSEGEAADLHWHQSATGNWIAEYKLNGVKTSAEYTANGNWIATRSHYTHENLPDPIANAIQSNYTTASIKDAVKIEKADQTAYYKVNLEIDGSPKTVLANDAGVITE